jgi:hypothetical protein
MIRAILNLFRSKPSKARTAAFIAHRKAVERGDTREMNRTRRELFAATNVELQRSRNGHGVWG